MEITTSPLVAVVKFLMLDRMLAVAASTDQFSLYWLFYIRFSDYIMYIILFMTISKSLQSHTYVFPTPTFADCRTLSTGVGCCSALISRVEVTSEWRAQSQSGPALRLQSNSLSTWALTELPSTERFLKCSFIFNLNRIV